MYSRVRRGNDEAPDGGGFPNVSAAWVAKKGRNRPRGRFTG
jgi:hypothetical protein